MKVRTLLRASSATRAAPFALGIVLVYFYFGSGLPPAGTFGHAPALVAWPLAATAPQAYAVAAALGAWEAGRLAKAEVWQLAPSRSRWVIAAQQMAPPVALAWAMLILGPLLAFLHFGTWPTIVSLGPLLTGFVLSAGFGIIGFGVGNLLPPIVAAPLTGLAVFIPVSWSWASGTWWLRHVSGLFGDVPSFGEAIPLTTLTPPLLLVAGLALGTCAFWVRQAPMAVRAPLGAAIALLGTFSAYTWTHDWGPKPPSTSVNVALSCAGHRPEVCMPTKTADDLAAVRATTAKVIGDLREAGVKITPERVTDSLAEGRDPRPSTPDVWHVGLTRASEAGALPSALLATAMQPPCAKPDVLQTRKLMLWGADIIGRGAAYQEWLAKESEPIPANTPQAKQSVLTEVKNVLDKPTVSQQAWYVETMASACQKGKGSQ